MDRLKDYTNILYNEKHKEYYKLKSKTISIAMLPIAILHNENVVDECIKEKMVLLDLPYTDNIFYAIKKNINSDLESILPYGIKNTLDEDLNSNNFYSNLTKGLDILNVYTNFEPKYINSTNNTDSSFKNKVLTFANAAFPIKIDSSARTDLINKNSGYIYKKIKEKNKIKYNTPTEMFSLFIVSLYDKCTKEAIDRTISKYAKSNYGIINNECNDPLLYEKSDLIKYYSEIKNKDTINTDDVLKAVEKIKTCINKYSDNKSITGLNDNVPTGNYFYEAIVREILDNKLIKNEMKEKSHLNENVYNYIISHGKEVDKLVVIKMVDSVYDANKIEKTNKPTQPK